MMWNGGIYVPPNCPAYKKGDIADLRRVPFLFSVYDCSQDSSGNLTQTEIFAIFGKKGERGDFPNAIQPLPLVVPIDSAVAEKAYWISGGQGAVGSEENEHVARLRDILLARVARCRGVVGGMCWALDEVGLQEAIESV